MLAGIPVGRVREVPGGIQGGLLVGRTDVLLERGGARLEGHRVEFFEVGQGFGVDRREGVDLTPVRCGAVDDHQAVGGIGWLLEALADA